MTRRVAVPEHWTRQNIESFLRFIEPDAEDKESRDALILRAEPKHHCWKNGGCLFWHQTSSEEWQGECGLNSCECITAVTGRHNPTRWSPRQ